MRYQKFTPFLLTAMLAGCSVGPEYQKPEVPMPASWQNAADSSSWPDPNWWQQFQLAELDQLMQVANQGNFDLAVAVARLKQANAQAEIAGAPLLPQIAATANGERIRQQPGYKTGSKSFTGYLSASYELDFWGKLADLADNAALTARASAFDRQTAELTLQATLANSYLQLLALNQRIMIARNNLSAAETIADAYRARLEVGASSQLDLAQQQTLVEQQRAALPPLLLQQRQTLDAIAVLVGHLPESLTAPKADLQQLHLPAVMAGLPSALLARRPDVQSAEARLQAANANVRAAVAAMFPAITLTAEGGGASSALSNLFKPAGAFYLLNGALSQPIFRGGVLEGGRDLAQGQYDEQAALYGKAVISAFADVEDALAAVQQQARQEQADQAARDSARQAYEIAQAQLYSGTIDLQTLLNTQRSLFQSEDQLAQVKLLHAQAVVALFRALGGGWQGTEKG
jgi:NodT family efflux transporter outer membrane factor (OMF) lipoprotein